MLKITKYDKKCLDFLHIKSLFYHTYKIMDINVVHTPLFIWNEEYNKKLAFIYIKNGNTYMWFDLKVMVLRKKIYTPHVLL